MPFRETSRLEERIAMLADYATGAFTVSQLCRDYGVSRPAFYAWLARRASGAQDWFVERSHAPASCPHRTPEAVCAAVVEVKRRFPRFGPKKVRARLQRERPGLTWPAASTIGDILKREGLVEARAGRRRRPVELGRVGSAAAQPNDEWACDFKGWFRTRDGRRCDPLTVTDTASRYLLEVRIAPPTAEGVRPAFERLFADHGLPGAIRCDNGPPFGSGAAGGLSRLCVWWLKLGIEPRAIRPASPQDNGRHERMHRTLKADTADPPAASLAEQQARFDAFRVYYNAERPHEGLGQAAPADLWTPSARPLPKAPIEPWYDAFHQVRRVRTNGEIKWRGGFVFISEVLSGEVLGLLEREDGAHLVRFFHVPLGVIENSGQFRRFAPLRHRLRSAPEPPPQQYL
jgi:transposase InsO family protein